MAGARTARLLIRGGPDDGRRIHITGNISTMGRAQINDIVVEESWVSRQHAIIRRQHNGYWIEDLGSQNGTFVNGERVTDEGRRLRDSDRIELGSGGTVCWVFTEPEATREIARPPGPQGRGD